MDAAAKRIYSANYRKRPGMQEKITSYMRNYRIANIEHLRSRENAWRAKVRAEVLDAYGGVCVCCGENLKPLLSIDHENDDGKHDREKNKTSFRIYLRLRREGYPAGHRVMCLNCNIGRNINGGICPHEEARKSLIGV